MARHKRRRGGKFRPAFGRLLGRRIVWVPLVLALLAFAGYVAWLDHLVTSRFDGRRWNLPAHVYARPLDLYAGLPFSAEALVAELQRLGYRQVASPDRPGTWRRSGAGIEFVTRPFQFWDGQQEAQRARVSFAGGSVAALQATDGSELALLRLDPLLIGSVFPVDGEDRIILAPGDVPPLIPAALKVIEDRRFDQHPGVDVFGILRAMWVNLISGEVRQGASTLTQQLVRSYFLSNERTLSRKLREALMALLLEAHYDKADILNAYVNEIYLGQDGSRAIHGFGLASQFYFSKPLAELQLHEVATLVAIVRGPSYYDPRRHAERVLERRNLVLRLLAGEQVITEDEARAAAKRQLGIVLDRNTAATYYPAFMALVHRELSSHYRQSDLTTEGLKVFTSLDPAVQARADKALATGVARLQNKKRPPLEGALVAVNPQTSEVLAVVGGRRTGFEGYNRALDARRPIGSLVKPVVYLAAIEAGQTLATIVDDAPIVVRIPGSKNWIPQNYDKHARGPVPLVRALAESLNMATVRLGLEVGVPRVAKLIERLGVQTEVAAHPSLLLGSLELAPLEVAQVYSTLASGGFRTPLRAVRSVQGPDGAALQQFPLETEQAVDPAAAWQIEQGMVQVMQRGTGAAASARLPYGVSAAGKTGTSNDLRDSWFAGYTGNLLAVVWMGNDDNQPVGLTGASGAMSVWSEFMAQLPLTGLASVAPPGFMLVGIDYPSGLAADASCGDVVYLPVPEGTVVPWSPACGGR